MCCTHVCCATWPVSFGVLPAAYLHTTAQFVFDADAAGQIPELLSHWFHAANMGIVLGVSAL
jgi:peptidyl-tRNA hydrolase